MITLPSIQGSLRDLANNNALMLQIAGNPVDGTAGSGANIAGPGAYLIDTTNGTVYINVGTLLSPSWVNVIKQLKGFISAANIIGTAAGQFGHANGVILAAAPGALVAYEPISLVLNYRFAVAAYTAGGNTTLNQGAGGAAITGLVSAANSIGAASSKDVLLVPLATVGIPLVRNGPLNLVSSAAFTNPGTAAGVITWILNCRVHVLDIN